MPSPSGEWRRTRASSGPPPTSPASRRCSSAVGHATVGGSSRGRGGGCLPPPSGPPPALARCGEMLRGGGARDGRRIVSRAVVELFPARAGIPGSTRALGWDTPTDETGRRGSIPDEPGYSSGGSLLSPRSFGHTGFTGTSMWMDPERRLYVILLTNRVHPTRENDAIRGVRAEVADAVVRALAPPRPRAPS